MRTRIYTDTSVIGGCFDPEFKEWSDLLIDEFRSGKRIIILSDLTLKELEDAPKQVRDIIETVPETNKRFIFLEEESKELARKYIYEDILTEAQLVDAQHIALATVYKVDLVVSWNFKHIVHYDKIRLFNSVNLKFGFPTLEIRSPQEVV